MKIPIAKGIKTRLVEGTVELNQKTLCSLRLSKRLVYNASVTDKGVRDIAINLKEYWSGLSSRFWILTWRDQDEFIKNKKDWKIMVVLVFSVKYSFLMLICSKFHAMDTTQLNFELIVDILFVCILYFWFLSNKTLFLINELGMQLVKQINW